MPLDHSVCTHYLRDHLYLHEIDDSILWLQRCRPGGAYVSMQEAVDKACEQRLHDVFVQCLEKKGNTLSYDDKQMHDLYAELMRLDKALFSAFTSLRAGK